MTKTRSGGNLQGASSVPKSPTKKKKQVAERKISKHRRVQKKSRGWRRMEMDTNEPQENDLGSINKPKTRPAPQFNGEIFNPDNAESRRRLKHYLVCLYKNMDGSNCLKCYNANYAIARHRSKDHWMRVYSCTHCGFETSERNRYTRHFRNDATMCNLKSHGKHVMQNPVPKTNKPNVRVKDYYLKLKKDHLTLASPATRIDLEIIPLPAPTQTPVSSAIFPSNLEKSEECEKQVQSSDFNKENKLLASASLNSILTAPDISLPKDIKCDLNTACDENREISDDDILILEKIQKEEAYRDKDEEDADPDEDHVPNYDIDSDNDILIIDEIQKEKACGGRDEEDADPDEDHVPNYDIDSDNYDTYEKQVEYNLPASSSQLQKVSQIKKTQSEIIVSLRLELDSKSKMIGELQKQNNVLSIRNKELEDFLGISKSNLEDSSVKLGLHIHSKNADRLKLPPPPPMIGSFNLKLTQRDEDISFWKSKYETEIHKCNETLLKYKVNNFTEMGENMIRYKKERDKLRDENNWTKKLPIDFNEELSISQRIDVYCIWEYIKIMNKVEYGYESIFEAINDARKRQGLQLFPLRDYLLNDAEEDYNKKSWIHLRTPAEQEYVLSFLAGYNTEPQSVNCTNGFPRPAVVDGMNVAFSYIQNVDPSKRVQKDPRGYSGIKLLVDFIKERTNLPDTAITVVLPFNNVYNDTSRINFTHPVVEELFLRRMVVCMPMRNTREDIVVYGEQDDYDDVIALNIARNDGAYIVSNDAFIDVWADDRLWGATKFKFVATKRRVTFLFDKEGKITFLLGTKDKLKLLEITTFCDATNETELNVHQMNRPKHRKITFN